MGHTKTMLIGKFIPISAFNKKIERSTIHNLASYLKAL